MSSNEKMQNWVEWCHAGSCDEILEFWDLLISRERLELETSNLAWRRTAVSSNEKNAKLGKRGHVGVT